MKTLESSDSVRTKNAELEENNAETETAEESSLLQVREKLLSLDFKPNTKQELDDMVMSHHTPEPTVSLERRICNG